MADSKTQEAMILMSPVTGSKRAKIQSPLAPMELRMASMTPTLSLFTSGDRCKTTPQSSLTIFKKKTRLHFMESDSDQDQDDNHDENNMPNNNMSNISNTIFSNFAKFEFGSTFNNTNNESNSDSNSTNDISNDKSDENDIKSQESGYNTSLEPSSQSSLQQSSQGSAQPSPVKRSRLARIRLSEYATNGKVETEEHNEVVDNEVGNMSSSDLVSEFTSHLRLNDGGNNNNDDNDFSVNTQNIANMDWSENIKNTRRNKNKINGKTGVFEWNGSLPSCVPKTENILEHKRKKRKRSVTIAEHEAEDEEKESNLNSHFNGKALSSGEKRQRRKSESFIDSVSIFNRSRMRLSRARPRYVGWDMDHGYGYGNGNGSMSSNSNCNNNSNNMDTLMKKKSTGSNYNVVNKHSLMTPQVNKLEKIERNKQQRALTCRDNITRRRNVIRTDEKVDSDIDNTHDTADTRIMKKNCLEKKRKQTKIVSFFEFIRKEKAAAVPLPLTRSKSSPNIIVNEDLVWNTNKKLNGSEKIQRQKQRNRKRKRKRERERERESASDDVEKFSYEYDKNKKAAETHNKKNDYVTFEYDPNMKQINESINNRQNMMKSGKNDFDSSFNGFNMFNTLNKQLMTSVRKPERESMKNKHLNVNLCLNDDFDENTDANYQNYPNSQQRYNEKQEKTNENTINNKNKERECEIDTNSCKNGHGMQIRGVLNTNVNNIIKTNGILNAQAFESIHKEISQRRLRNNECDIDHEPSTFLLERRRTEPQSLSQPAYSISAIHSMEIDESTPLVDFENGENNESDECERGRERGSGIICNNVGCIDNYLLSKREIELLIDESHCEMVLSLHIDDTEMEDGNENESDKENDNDNDNDNECNIEQPTLLPNIATSSKGGKEISIDVFYKLLILNELLSLQMGQIERYLDSRNNWQDIDNKNENELINIISRKLKIKLMKELEIDFEIPFSRFIVIDSRFTYEYSGGHFKDAWHVQDKDLILNIFDSNKPKINESRDDLCFIFHCEYSQARGPQACHLLREIDRKYNENYYPKLGFPHTYILHGGYKAFWEAYKDDTKCNLFNLLLPFGYVSMFDEKYRTQMQIHNTWRQKTWKSSKLMQCRKNHGDIRHRKQRAKTKSRIAR